MGVHACHVLVLVVDDDEERVGSGREQQRPDLQPLVTVGAYAKAPAPRSRGRGRSLSCTRSTSSSSLAMSSAAGLSRRRVTVSATSSGDDDVDNTYGSSSNGASRSQPLHSPSLHAGSAFEGGSKIAYDPRDLEREDEDVRLGGKPPRLTIMEEVLLLGLKDKQVSSRLGSLDTTHGPVHTALQALTAVGRAAHMCN